MTQMMVADEFYDGMPWIDLSELELKQGLETFACADMQQTSDVDFGCQIFRVLKMGARKRLPCENTLLTVGSRTW